ncbi:hypothetical protein CEUSTIGMA_g11389.t1 [Chlamydomonas eustigma]|uniref:Chitin-binding type-2 domain-containing protein n=1 Tax=Chlamydomonas eustigma TaxID=1157962 RepID=A0A250XLI1_9CHLO|nr:hypothetical protein CEUSTIGMA_g11389.t1 [Chlamydomonas eustigma]|eukprot:GAX83965.1 hypothetical protein CEUSTIGMA_g11389.t1 [Chlamydomonas eustigma]
MFWVLSLLFILFIGTSFVKGRFLQTLSCPTTAAAFCSGSSPGLHTNPCDGTCSTFFNCGNSGATSAQQSCPAGLLFNPQYLYCDYPQNVICSSGPSSSTLPNPPPTALSYSSPPPKAFTLPSTATIQPPPSSIVSGSNSTANTCTTGSNAQRATCFCQTTGLAGLFADVQNGCTGFFNCYTGGSVYTSCGSGLLFNNTLQYCNWAQDVICSPVPPSPPTPSPHPPTPPSPPSPPPSPPFPPGLAATQSGILFSPYKDVTVNMNWNTYVMSSTTSGTLSPVTKMMPSGLQVLTWAFATGECGSENWGGITPASIASNIPSFTLAGKQYIISTGGAAGIFTCGSDTGFSAFLSNYNSANLVGVDFDIEGGQTPTQISNLVARVKVAQATNSNLRFSFTLATLAVFGGGNQLNSLGTSVLQAIQAAGLSWNNLFINLMVMDYGTGSYVCTMGTNNACQMGQSAISAAEDLHSFWNVPYSSIELTPMIGGNDVASNVFTIADVSIVTTYAKSKGLGGIHFWSFDRDNDGCSAGSSASATCNSYGTAGALGFTNAFLAGL